MGLGGLGKLRLIRTHRPLSSRGKNMGELQRTPEQRFEHWHQQVCSGLRTTVEAAWNAGKALEEIKASRDHGTFGTWIETQGISSRTARRYMELARAFPSKRPPMADLSTGLVGTLKALKPKPDHSKLVYHYQEAQASARKAGEAAWHWGRNLAMLEAELEQCPDPPSLSPLPASCPGYDALEDLQSDATSLELEAFVDQYVERFMWGAPGGVRDRHESTPAS